MSPAGYTLQYVMDMMAKENEACAEICDKLGRNGEYFAKRIRARQKEITIQRQSGNIAAFEKLGESREETAEDVLTKLRRLAGI